MLVQRNSRAAGARDAKPLDVSLQVTELGPYAFNFMQKKIPVKKYELAPTEIASIIYFSF